MKKLVNRSFYVFALVLIVTMLSACGDSSTGGNDNEAGDDVVEYRMVGNLTELRLQIAKEYAEIIEERSNGTLKPVLYLEGQLGTNDEDLSTAISEGNFEVYLGQDMIPTWVAPDWLGYANVPFAYRGPDHVKAYWASEIGDEVNSRSIEELGVRIFTDGVGTRGARHVTAKKPITHVSDMQGLRFRTPNVEAVVNSWTAAGANVTSIPWAELFSSLQTGVVEAQENPFAEIDLAGLYEVQDYLMLTHHQYGVFLTYTNEAWWQGLSEEHQNIIQEVNKEMNEKLNESIAEADAELLEKFKEKGMTVVEESEIDIESFREAIIPAVLERHQADWAEGGWDLIQGL